MKERTPQLIRRLGFVLEASIVIPLGYLISCLPWKIGRGLTPLAGSLLFGLSHRGRKQAYKNLDIIYADNPLSQEEKTRITKRLFANITASVFEFLKLGCVTEGNFQRFARLENFESVDRAFEEGKGLLAITAHMGNWELLGSISAKLRKNLGAVIHRQLNPYTDKWLKEIREKRGKIICFYDEVSDMRRLVGHLKRKGALAILADEIYPILPVFVPFFGKQAATPDGPAKLHLRYGSPIVFCFSIRQADGKYLLTFDGPYHFERSGDLREDCEAIMTWINSKYEGVIRKHPDQWFSLLTPRWDQNRPEDFKDRPWR